MAGSDDLTSLFATEPAPVLRGSQGQLVQWDPSTFENRVAWRGSILTNVPISAGVDALSLSAGDVVLLVGFSSTDGGASSWWILGNASIPPLSNPVRISGGNVIIEGGGQLRVVREDGPGILVEGGGSVEIRDLGAIIVRHANGAPAAVYGNFANIGTGGAESGQGVLITTDTGEDIFRAKVDEQGQTIVAFSESGNSIGEFTGTADVISLQSTGSVGLFAGFVPGTVNFESGLSLNDTGTVSISSTNDSVLIDHQVAGGTANAAWSGDLLFEVSSSRRYKTDIRDYRIRPKTVLDLQPRTWRDKTEVERIPDTDRWHVGFIAEELHDAGLTDFVDYDIDGQPKAVTYDRLCVALLEHNRYLQGQLDALTMWATKQGYKPPAEPDIEPTVLPERRQASPPTAKEAARQSMNASELSKRQPNRTTQPAPQHRSPSAHPGDMASHA